MSYGSCLAAALDAIANVTNSTQPRPIARFAAYFLRDGLGRASSILTSRLTTLANVSAVVSVTFCFPDSTRETYCWSRPAASANCACVRPIFSRAALRLVPNVATMSFASGNSIRDRLGPGLAIVVGLFLMVSGACPLHTAGSRGRIVTLA